MADEIGSLLVRIDAEDNASAVLARVSGSISGLGGASAAGTKSLSGLNGAMNAGKTTAESYKSKMADTAKVVSNKKTALNAAKTAYEAATKESEKNTAELKHQKSNIESLIRAKESEIAAIEHSNTIVNKGSQAYKDNQKALEWTRTELSELEAQHKSITQSMDAHEVSVARAAKAYETAKAEVEAAENTYTRYTSGLGEVEKAERAAAKAANAKNWEDTGKGIKEFGDGLDSATKPLQYAAAGAVAGGIAVSKMAMDYETAFTGVKKTVDGTPEQLARVDKEIREMSKTIPVGASELANLAAVGGQLGVGVESISKFTETMAAMGVATNLGGEEGAAAMAQFLNVMGENVNNIDRAGSAIVALGNNTATTEADIAAMAVRMGKAGKTVGMNTQQVLGYSAALSSMGIEAQLGGSAIGRTWIDIETAVNSGGDALNAYAKYAGVSAKDFAKQWSTDPSGAFNGLIKGLSATENLTNAMLEMGINGTQDQQVIMALAGGYDMLNKCLNLSSTAYRENTALTNEANAAYNTTANKLKLAKNAVTGAAMSWGELLLPEIKNGAEWVGGLADKVGSLDDGTKRMIVSGAKTAIVLGGVSKAGVGMIKTVGDVADGVGKIKGGLSKLSKVAPAFTAIGSAALPAAAGIAAVGSALIVGKKAYELWYNSQYKWGEKLAEPTAKLKESISAMKELNDLQWEFGDLSGKIQKGELEGEELEAAKSRLAEIVKLLNEKYHLDIDFNLDDLEQANKIVTDTIEKTRQQQYSDFVHNKAQMGLELSESVGKYKEGKGKKESLQKEYDEQKKFVDEYSKIVEDFNLAKTKFDEAKNNKQSAAKLGKDSEEYKRASKNFNEAKEAYDKAEKKYNSVYIDQGPLDAQQKKLDNLKNKLDDTTQSMAQFEAARDEYVLGGLSEYANGYTAEGLETLRGAVQDYGADAMDTAQKLTALQTGFNDVGAAIKGSDLTGYLNQYIANMREFGASSKDISLATALIKNGFNDLKSAADAGKISEVFNDFAKAGKSEGLNTEQIVEFANALNLIPDDKHIEISAEGDVSLVENVVEKTAEIDGKAYKIKLDAEGNVSILDEAAGKAEVLQGLGAVSVSVNAQGDTVLLDKAGAEVAKIKQLGDLTIAVDASGNVTLLDTASEKAKEIADNENITLKINAEGDGLNVIDQFKGKIGEISKNGEVEVEVKAKPKFSLFKTAEAAEIEPINATADVNVTPGNIDTSPVSEAIASSVQSIQGNTQVDVTVTAKANGAENVKTLSDAVNKVQSKNVSVAAKVMGKPESDSLKKSIDSVNGKTVKVAANVSGKGAVSSLKSEIDGLSSKTVTIKVNYVTTGAKPNAKGTQNFSGGLAMVNDEEGISDPRELIIDNGRAFIPHGKNVILPLSKGARVYTAAQTKRIMSNMGIPRYADGKENSDAFTAAKDDWTHYTKTHAVTVTQELEKWVELSKKFTGNIKDAEDIEEEIFNAVRKVRDEQNELSKAYISDRAELNDWGSWGDTAIDAFNRVRERENKYVADSKITAKEADKYLVDLGENMYNSRIANSKAWLNHEEKYNKMAAEDYISGLSRMAEYTDEYYANGLISATKYIIAKQELEDMRLDKISEANKAEYEAWKKDAAQYRKRSETYGWGNDSETEFLKRYREKVKKFYNESKIDYEEYIYDYQDAHMDWYQNQADTYDAALKKAEEYISQTEENQRKVKDAFEDKWNIKKLDANIKEQAERVRLYTGAVTARGKAELKSAKESLADYRHERAAYALQEKQTEELKSLRRDLNRLETGKKTYLAAISGSVLSAERYIKTLNQIPEDMRDIMSSLLAAIKNIKIQGGNTSTYGDTNYNIQMPNVEGNFIYKLNRALGGY